MSWSEGLPPVIGHRGAAALAPENTLAGIRRAHREGARWVEFDVKLTLDGLAILMHDDRLERTTSGRGAVAQASAATIAGLDAGRWFGEAFAGEPVPTLRSALDLCAELRLGINLELKPCSGRGEATARRALAVIGEAWPDDLPQPLISSFDLTALEAAMAIAPELPRGYLCTRVPRSWPAILERFGCSTLNVSDRWIRTHQIEAARAAGVPVLVYTVNHPARLRALLDAGVTSVITDRVDVLLAGLLSGGDDHSSTAAADPGRARA